MGVIIKDYLFSIAKEHTAVEVSIIPPVDYDKATEVVDIKIFDMGGNPSGSMFFYDGVLEEKKLTTIKVIKNRKDIEGSFFMEAEIKSVFPKDKPSDEEASLLGRFGFLNKSALMKKFNLEEGTSEVPSNADGMKESFKKFVDSFGRKISTKKKGN